MCTGFPYGLDTLVKVIFGGKSSSFEIKWYSVYAFQIIARNSKCSPYRRSPDISDFVPLNKTPIVYKLVKKFQSFKLSTPIIDILIFCTLLNRNQSPSIISSTSSFHQPPQLKEMNNWGTGQSPTDLNFLSNPSIPLNVDASNPVDYLPAAQAPASLWGSTSRMGTLSRHSKDRQVYCGQASAKSAASVAPSTFPVEQELLREAILTLSGASGSLIQYDPTLDAFVPSPNLTLLPSVQGQVMSIASCGWLYNRVSRFVNGVRSDPNTGKVTMSLALAIDEHLTEYLRLVSMLEAQMNSDPETSNVESNLNSLANSTTSLPASRSLYSLAGATNRQPEGGLQSELALQPLTLITLNYWLMEPKRRLKILVQLCDSCSSLKGGALVSKVYEMAQHGGQQIRSMLRAVLTNMSGTIYEMIAMWIYDGRLLPDLNQEFFITVNPSVGKESLWMEKYGVRKDMVPAFISREQARKILLVGKSANFLMHACGDSLIFKDLEAIRKTRVTRVESLFDQSFDNSFDRMISTAYNAISKHLLKIMFEKYHLIEHLSACRKFLLLGQGDFIQRLIDLLKPELDLPADQIMRHRLNEVLETAIRDTNAQYEDAEILQRLSVGLLDITDGDSGWDVFSLSYEVHDDDNCRGRRGGPLGTVLTPDCQLFYLQVFSFLFRLKRMEMELSGVWREQLQLARLPLGLAADLTPLLHLDQLFGAEVRHFVLQLQYYVNFEALECSWLSLLARVRVSARDLDEVIEAHRDFLATVLSRCLLDSLSSDLRYHLRAIFDVITNFAQFNRDLVDIAVDEMDVRLQLQEQTEASAKKGRWGTCETLESEEIGRRKVFVENTVGTLIARIRVLASSYRTKVDEFVGMLQNHAEANLRLLAQNLNFNGHYMI